MAWSTSEFIDAYWVHSSTNSGILQWPRLLSHQLVVDFVTEGAYSCNGERSMAILLHGRPISTASPSLIFCSVLVKLSWACVHASMRIDAAVPCPVCTLEHLASLVESHAFSAGLWCLYCALPSHKMEKGTRLGYRVPIWLLEWFIPHRAPSLRVG